jgi:tRNA threonylcarbamoyladenosine biosynthesis protein TsaB
MKGKPDYLLAIDTATAWQSVALLRGGEVSALIEQDAEGSHARSLIKTVDCVLRKGDIQLKDLQGLALSIGPGSFTGLRVGLATMLGFRAVLGIPIAPVPTLEAMTWNVREVTGLLVPILKSRHNEVYWAAYEWRAKSGLHTVIGEQVGPPASVARVLQASNILTCFGDGWQAYQNHIREALDGPGVKIQEVRLEQHRPSAVSVGLAARQLLNGGQIAGPALVPRYVQRTEAEVQFDAQQGLSPLERRRQRMANKLTQKQQRAVAKRADSRRGK